MASTAVLSSYPPVPTQRSDNSPPTLITLDLDTLLVTLSEEDAWRGKAESNSLLTRIDTRMTAHPENLPQSSKNDEQTHNNLKIDAEDDDDDDDASLYSEHTRDDEPFPSSFSDPGHYAYSDTPSRAFGEPARYNGAIADNQPLASSSSQRSPHPSLQSANAQEHHTLAGERRSHERLRQIDSAIELAEHEYGGVSELPPPVPPKPSRTLRQARSSSMTSLASASSAPETLGATQRRPERSFAAREHRRIYTMSDPGHGSDVVRIRSEYPPLDAVLESSRRDQQQVAFPSSSSYASSSIITPHQSRYYGSTPHSTLNSSRYAASADFHKRSAGSMNGPSASSHRRSDSHVTFTVPDSIRTRKVSNKLRKPARHVKARAMSVPADERPAFAEFQHLTSASPAPMKPIRSPSPRQRQRKESLLSRVFSFRRRKSSTGTRKAETEYTTELPLLPPAYQRKSVVSINEEVESEYEEDGTEEEWRRSWWSEDGHASGQPSSLRPTPPVSAFLPTTTTTTTAEQDDSDVGPRLTLSARTPSRHGDEPPHTVCDSQDDSMNAPYAFGTGLQAPAGHDRHRQGDRHLPTSFEISPTTMDHHREESNNDLLHTQPSPPRPQQHRPRVLVKRTRSNASQPSVDSRPTMLASHSSTSSTTHTTASSRASSGLSRSSVASSPYTSPGTSEAHASPSSSSACPPARPQTYFAELQLPTATTNPVPGKARARSSTHFDTSFFDTRYPRAVHGNGSQGSSSTSTLNSRAQSRVPPPASITLAPTQIATSPSSSSPAGRKLTKKRPQSQALPTCRYSASASTIGTGRSSMEQLASPPGIEVQASGRGRSAARAKGRDGKSKSRSRSRSVVCAKIRGSIHETKEKKGRGSISERGHGNEKVDYLPPMRVLEPLWVGNGALPSPHVRHSHAFSSTNFPSASSLPTLPSTKTSTTDALTSLAFTGNTGLLSSSALAALTSRLAQNAQLASDQNRPPSPFLLSVKEYEEVAFDPYAEEKENKKSRKKDTKGRGPTYRSSFAFLRVDSAAAPSIPRKSSPVPPVPALPQHLKHQQQRSDEPLTSSKPATRAQSRAPENSPNALRRWTLAMADVDDDVLVQELEKFRLEAQGPWNRKRRSRAHMKRTPPSSVGHGDGEACQTAFVYGGPEEAKWKQEWIKLGNEREDSDSESDYSQSELGGCEDSPVAMSIDDAGWKTARRALLCCRDLVRTERNYQAKLRQLLAGETETRPPALVLSYVPALLRASETLLSRLEDDPSAWGVSAGFVGVEEEVEAAFVAWCGIVGEIFEGDGNSSATREGRKATRSPAKTSSRPRAQSGTRGHGKRTASGVSLSQAPPSGVDHPRAVSFLEDPAQNGAGMGMFTAALGTGLAYTISPSVQTSTTDEFGAKGSVKPDGQTRSVAGVHANTTGSGSLSLSKAFRRMSVFSSASSLPSTPTSPTSTLSASTGKKAKKEKKPSVRELAIQPTQRVMRYVLQYRDLLTNTPLESPSRGLVERALESALRIAAKCDRAQGNSAFLRRV